MTGREQATGLWGQLVAVAGLRMPQTPTEMERALLDPVKRQAFYLAKLPALSFYGISVLKLDASSCEINLPFTWRTQNPFQSIYFGAQTSAAELSTGALLLRAISGQPALSMLVVGMEGQFSKKAKADLRFTCPDGPVVAQAVERALAGEAQEFVLRSVGRLPDGVEASSFQFRWALKRKEPSKGPRRESAR